MYIYNMVMTFIYRTLKLYLIVKHLWHKRVSTYFRIIAIHFKFLRNPTGALR